MDPRGLGSGLRPPDDGPRLPTRVLLALLGDDLSASHFLACGGERGSEPPQGGFLFSLTTLGGHVFRESHKESKEGCP